MLACLGFGFAPRNFAFCSGQLVSISQNTALYSLLGTAYGGDGRTVFALPELRGRAPVGYGQQPGFSLWRLGDQVGQEYKALNMLELPVHNHNFITDSKSVVSQTEFRASTTQGTKAIPSDGDYIGAGPAFGAPQPAYVPKDFAGTTVALSGASTTSSLDLVAAIGSTGGGQAFSIMQPVQAVNWCICISGIYPSRT
ncbi:phage tail protein [Roseibium hamelinense]|nr:phage tail protein [Roseibium hamelinense]